jgi:hypothetical protein
VTVPLNWHPLDPDPETAPAVDIDKLVLSVPDVVPVLPE